MKVKGLTFARKNHRNKLLLGWGLLGSLLCPLALTITVHEARGDTFSRHANFHQERIHLIATGVANSLARECWRSLLQTSRQKPLQEQERQGKKAEKLLLRYKEEILRALRWPLVADLHKALMSEVEASGIEYLAANMPLINSVTSKYAGFLKTFPVTMADSIHLYASGAWQDLIAVELNDDDFGYKVFTSPLLRSLFDGVCREGSVFAVSLAVGTGVSPSHYENYLKSHAVAHWKRYFNETETEVFVTFFAQKLVRDYFNYIWLPTARHAEDEGNALQEKMLASLWPWLVFNF